ncbi:hypothetical protein B0H13DRAFT_2277462, partial [Mycena leptocephala]
MPPKTTTSNEFVQKAVLDHITHPGYKPPSLPFVKELKWPSCFDSEDTEVDIGGDLVSKSAQERSYYYQTGLATLQQVLFLLLIDDLVDKPAGYFSAVQNAVESREVLKELIKKIDERLLANIVTAARVDTGFCEFIGVLWALERQNTEAVTWKLRPIFRPLLRVAGKADVSKSAKVKSVQKATTKRDQRLPTDLQFIQNVQNVQKHPASQPALFQSPSNANGSNTTEDSVNESDIGSPQPQLAPSKILTRRTGVELLDEYPLSPADPQSLGSPMSEIEAHCLKELLVDESPDAVVKSPDVPVSPGAFRSSFSLAGPEDFILKSSTFPTVSEQDSVLAPPFEHADGSRRGEWFEWGGGFFPVWPSSLDPQ